MAVTADIIVIGGGIAGVSAAAELTATARVIVLEREPQPGYHATGRSAAFFVISYGNAAVRAVTAMSVPFTPAGVFGCTVAAAPALYLFRPAGPARRPVFTSQ